MAKKETPTMTLTYSNNNDIANSLENGLGNDLREQRVFVAWIVGSKKPDEVCNLCLDTAPRIAIVFQGCPLDTSSLAAWRDWALEKAAVELRTEFVATVPESPADFVRGLIGDWLGETTLHEEVGLHRGKLVALPLETDAGADLLTLYFGKQMSTLLSRMDRIRRAFRDVCSPPPKVVTNFLAEVTKALKDGGAVDGAEVAPNFVVRPSQLPRVLLTGETGTGKTLFARFLAGLEDVVPVTKISVPEYLGNEEMLEYELFGYAAGAYTGGRKDGYAGLLVQAFGRVVFLDEIGEASPHIQAKLLAYLDDFRVRPRGSSAVFYCPALVVAATNRLELGGPVGSNSSVGGFRADLLRRFTDRLTIPPLRDRIGSPDTPNILHLLLDCLLQSDGINRGGAVSEISHPAVELLRGHSYWGNFRELEDIVRAACVRAAAAGRRRIVTGDLALSS